MMFQDLKFRVARDELFDPTIGIRFWSKSTDGSSVILPEPIVMKQHKIEDVGYTGRGADISLWPSSAQQLMDELWNVGFRPSEGTGSAGSLAATQRHLGDMRSLVGKLLKTELPK